MPINRSWRVASWLIATPLMAALLTPAYAQTGGNSGSINGTVLDSTGSVVPGATVEIHNPVSGFDRTTTTDTSGKFEMSNVPFNPYHLTVKAEGFMIFAQDVEPRSSVPVTISIQLQVAGSTTTVTVEAEGGDLVETDSTFHTDLPRELIEKSESSTVSSIVTQSSPGIAADSNGMFHGLGDHAENSFSVDGQPITDQQSKIFSNQIPLEAIQSMEVIAGAPPAEYGDKTSVVINVTTQSGQGVTTPHGTLTTSYGTFGTSNLGLTLAYGGKSWGNFISASGLNTGRFLDPPEFVVMHDKGNEESFFDRVDYQLSPADSIHVNLGYTRSWFQTPNSYDSQNATAWSGVVVNNNGLGPDGNPVGPSDQRSQIKTFNIAPSWTRLINTNSVFTLGGFVRRDQFNYYPSNNPFSDLGPVNLQRETVAQNRNLTNAGLRSDISYVKGIHNLKGGAVYQQTFLNENDSLGIVDPTLLASLVDANGVPCYLAATHQALDAPCTVLIPYDLTQPSGGSLYTFRGHTDVKEFSIYLRDNMTMGKWSVNVGMRGDFYNGLSTHREAEPRLGVAYNIKKTSTVLRVSYARVLETPFNENLVLSSQGCNNAVLNPLLGCFEQGQATPLSPGWRNEFHAGLQQAFGRYLVFSGEYIWKYTHDGYDFSILGNTPITFPVEWERSKIPGYAGHFSVPEFHGFSAMAVFSSVAARFFTPQVGGAGAVPSAVLAGGSIPFRIDHDEKFNLSTHLQYQPWKTGPWFGFNWRYDSGQVAGQTPCYGDNCAQTTTDSAGDPAIAMTDSFKRPLSADEEFEAGLFCGAMRATPTQALPNPCPVSEFGSTLLKVPAPNTANSDSNPPRIQPRDLFDVAVGHDNVFRGDRYKVSLRLTAINVTNKYALYNFLSTFSGTHYVTPRTLTAELGFHF